MSEDCICGHQPCDHYETLSGLKGCAIKNAYQKGNDCPCCPCEDYQARSEPHSCGNENCWIKHRGARA